MTTNANPRARLADFITMRSADLPEHQAAQEALAELRDPQTAVPPKIDRLRFSPAIEQSITDTLHTFRTAAEAAFWTLVEWRKAAERHGR